MFDPDLVVAWMAEHQSGSLTTLAQTVTWAASGTQVQARTWIGRLPERGIANIDWQNGRWTARECVLTPLPGPTATFVLAGTRPDTVQAYERQGAVTYRQAPDGRLPEPSTIWWQFGAPYEAEGKAASLGIQTAPCAARHVAGSLKFERPHLSTSAPGGFTAERFNPATLEFEVAELIPKPRQGLYRGNIDGNRTRYMFYDGEQWYLTGRWDGVYLALPNGSYPFAWRPEPGKGSTLGTLVIDRQLWLPPAHSEAAVMCTGLPPSITPRAIEYDGVPLPIADQIARSLRRPLHRTRETK